ncbi:MAG TPA: fumarate reductase cytochrome b subunit [Casimicrobiaceae bacterium]|nr:fumarate reductase cytochrome b subunit [Casimicrobiaceae bacterium]
MERARTLIAGVGLFERTRRSRWPARLDVAEGAAGLVLVLFMWGHMLFVSSILLGRDAMWTVTRFFEGYFFFGSSHPWIVSIVVAVIIALIVVHAMLALRKFPINYRQYRSFRGHMRMMRHEDTTLWFWQVITGYALFFLAPAHLYVMLTRPDRIGPFESADRVWSDHFWPLYLILLFAVELHGGIGLYRLAIKWGWFASDSATTTRHRLRTLKWAITAVFLILGLTTLAAYMKIGIAHSEHYGERYTPTFLQPSIPAVPR